jgi:hypothetical protein
VNSTNSPSIAHQHIEETILLVKIRLRSAKESLFENNNFCGFQLTLGHSAIHFLEISRYQYNTDVSVPDFDLGIESVWNRVPDANLTIKPVRYRVINR